MLRLYPSPELPEIRKHISPSSKTQAEYERCLVECDLAGWVGGMTDLSLLGLTKTRRTRLANTVADETLQLETAQLSITDLIRPPGTHFARLTG